MLASPRDRRQAIHASDFQSTVRCLFNVHAKRTGGDSQTLMLSENSLTLRERVFVIFVVSVVNF